MQRKLLGLLFAAAAYGLYKYSRMTPEELLQPLLTTINDLKIKFGNWQIPWGEINRFQRISSDIDNKFDDNKPSIPVGFVASTWGMLPSFVSRTFPGTKKRYGYNGNSFVCAVEFGEKIKARSLFVVKRGCNNSSGFAFVAKYFALLT